MDKALGYLGMAARAGRLAIGAEDCGKVLRARKGKLLIAASDAGSATVSHVTALARDRCPVLCTAYTKNEIARAVGRAVPVAVVLITDEGLARAFAASAQLDRGEEEERV